MNLDLILFGATVVDGTGRRPFEADIGILHGRIAVMGALEGAVARTRIDVSGLVVSPGFVDAHAHVEAALLAPGGVAPKVAQGVTTEILGQDGLSYAPLDDDLRAEQSDYLSAINGSYDGAGRTFAEFLGQYEGRVVQNVASLAPYGAIRVAVAGWANRGLSEEEVAQTSRLAKACLDDGAVGVALGLDYFPQSLATTAELTALGRVVAEHGSVLVAHTRSRELGIVESVRELVDVARTTGARVHVSHLRSDQALPVVDEAVAAGIDITFDVYPYTIASSMLMMHIPPWVLDGGPDAARPRLADKAVRERIAPHLDTRLGHVLDEYVISGVGRGQFAELVGETLAGAMKEMNCSLADGVAQLLVANDLQVTYVGSSFSEASVAACAAHPAAMGCSDAILVGTRPHPRGWGAFPRFISQYVREANLMSLEECVHKLTGKTAARFGLKQRGVVATGAAADLVVFDAERIQDRATFEEPTRHPDGVHAVLVGGCSVWPGSPAPDSRPGVVLRSECSRNWSSSAQSRAGKQ